MARLNDYLAKNMDKTISEFPLNELDYALITQLSYLDLEGIVSAGSGKTSLKDAYKVYSEQNRANKKPGIDDLFIKLANSTRYGNLKLSHFVQTEVPETYEQFGAVAIDTGLNHKMICFRPTNGTLYSWKENFTVCYKETSETQDRALEYLNKVALMHPFQQFSLIGHSKGGNNAMYSAGNTNWYNQQRIRRIINFDGPGFNTPLNKGITNKSVLDKVTTIIPQGSVVGRLLDHKEKVIVIQAGENHGSFFNHDMNEWNVGETSFLRDERTNYKSNALDRKIREIFGELSIKEQKLLVDGVFNILGNTGYTELQDVIDNPKTLFSAYFKTDKESRVMVRNVALKVLKDRKFIKTMFGKDAKNVEGYLENFAKENQNQKKVNHTNYVKYTNEQEEGLTF